LEEPRSAADIPDKRRDFGRSKVHGRHHTSYWEFESSKLLGSHVGINLYFGRNRSPKHINSDKYSFGRSRSPNDMGCTSIHSGRRKRSQEDIKHHKNSLEEGGERGEHRMPHR
jgi:hypothetical protein